MRLLLCKNRRAEVRQLCENLQAVLSQGMAPSAISVVVSSPSTYLPMMKVVAQDLGVSFNYEIQVPLAGQPSWSVLWQLHDGYRLYRDGRPPLIAVKKIVSGHLLAMNADERFALEQSLVMLPWNVAFKDLQPILPKIVNDFFSTITTTTEPCHVVMRRLLQWVPESFGGKELTTLLDNIEVDPQQSYLQQMAAIQERVRQTMVTVKRDDPQGIKVIAASEMLGLQAGGCELVYCLGLTADESYAWRKVALPSMASLIMMAPMADLDGAILEPLTTIDGRSLEPLTQNDEVRHTELVMPPEPAIAMAPPTQLAASAIAQYALCPYRYFARYVLQLNDKEVGEFWQLSSRRLGEFVHRVFELKLLPLFFDKEVPGQKLESDIDVIAKEFFPSGMHGAFQTMEWRQLRLDLQKALSDEVAYLKKYNLQPMQVETLLTLICELSQRRTIAIRCRIDRIDKIEGVPSQKPAVGVVDYKTRRGSVDPKYRLQMQSFVQPQLPLYMLAVAQQGNYEPYGAVEVRLRSGKRGGLVRDELAKRFKSQSFAKLPEVDLLPRFQRQLNDLLERLTANDFRPAPQDPVDQCGLGACPYWAVCRFDKPTDENDPVDEEDETDDAVNG